MTEVFCAALKHVQSGTQTSALAKDTVQVLQVAAGAVPADDVPALVEVLVAPLLERRGSASLDGPRRDGCVASLELLPKLLARAASKATELRPDSSRLCEDLSKVTGVAYAERIVHDLCKVTWPGGTHVKLVEVFKVLRAHLNHQNGLLQ